MSADRPTHPEPKWLFSYTIASGDMYYSEMEIRDLYAYQDPDKGFRVWGELHGAGIKTAVNLCQIMLEYGMYVRSWCNDTEANYHMSDFGSRLGVKLASVLKEAGPALKEQCPGACALMCVLESMDVQLSIEQVGPELHFISAMCPIEETALRTAMREVDLAYVGVNALCQSLIHAFDPKQILRLPLTTPADHHFSASLTVSA